ncbi:MAG: 40S ribosomal protein S19 [Candidatus Pacearchaeota archaeon]
MSIYNISHREFNVLLTAELKKMPEFKAPEWIHFVKTGVNKQRPTEEVDFWHRRAASILRQFYVQAKPLGVNRLKKRYGGRKSRGAKPPKTVTGGGKIIRLILQQTEKAGLTEKAKTGKAGRILTQKGRKFLEEIALKSGGKE